MQIAILIACHGNAEVTEKSIQALKENLPREMGGRKIKSWLYAVDDCCPEGSAGMAVRTWGENSTLIKSKKPRFWAQSMAIAETEAKRRQYDHIIWINQDTVVTAPLHGLLGHPTIKVGTCLIGEEAAKGALIRDGNPCRFRLCRPEEPAETFNGNLVCIPRRVFETQTIQGFKHAFADIDYGLQAHKAGVIIESAGIIAKTLPQRKNWRDMPTIRERLRACMEPTGLPPEDWVRFCQMHGGPLWPLRIIWPYRHIILRRRVWQPNVGKQA